MKKPYIAHSKLIDEEKGKNIPDQPYQNHIEGVYNGCLTSLNRIKKHVDPLWYPVLHRSVLLAAIFHDLGKLDDQAQSFLRGEIKSKMINHVDAGVSFLLSQYEKSAKNPKERDICYLIAAYLVLAHHIGLPNYNRVIKTERQMLSIILSPDKSFRDRKSLKKYDMGRKMVKTHVDKNIKRYIEIHRGLTQLAVEGDKVPRKNAMSFIGNPIALKIAISILVDADHEDTCINYGDSYPVKRKHLDAIYHIENLRNKVQQMAEDHRNGKTHCSEDRFQIRQEFFNLCGDGVSDYPFYLVDGTVGVGKTFGVMHLALNAAIEYDLDNLVFVLPYISLIDQSAKQYKEALFADANEVDYHMGVIHSIYKAKGAFHRRYAKGFNAPINLTTSVNFFSVLSSNCTSIFKNLHKLAGSVIAFDEYHAMASYEHWNPIMKMMKDLSKHFSCRFIFSSGTPIRFWEIESLIKGIQDGISVKNVIPQKTYEAMIAMEMKRVKITTSLNEHWAFNRLADEVLKQDKSTFVILNTRRKTVAFVNRLRKKTNRKVYLRFSGVASGDRDRQYVNVKRDVDNQEPVIVVATQGSDIGLDLSFFCGFKESSSYDSIVQMLGRINRGCEFEGSFLHIFKFCEEPNEDGRKYRNNPAFAGKTDIFESEIELHKHMSPEYSTHIAEREVDNMSSGVQDKMKAYIGMWDRMDFEDFGDSFSLISMPMIHIIINPDIFEKMKRGEYVPYSLLQSNIVNLIWSEKHMELLKDHLISVQEVLDDGEVEEEEYGKQKPKNNTFGLYYWKGVYDPEVFGIFADPVFEMVELKTLIV